MAKRKMSTKSKLLLWQVIGVVVSFAPILFEVLVHKNTYFATKSAGWSFTIGGVIAVVLVGLAMVGKLSKLLGSEISVIGTVFVMAMLLEPIVMNLKLLSFLLLCGMCANGMFVKPIVKRLKRRIVQEEQAGVLREALNG
jgi:hypothetical protein